MILIRNVFRVKFGKAREAVALMKEGRRDPEAGGRTVDVARADRSSQGLLHDRAGTDRVKFGDVRGGGAAIHGRQGFPGELPELTPLIDSGYREASRSSRKDPPRPRAQAGARSAGLRVGPTSLNGSSL